jgi:GDP-L-fucose synthase
LVVWGSGRPVRDLVYVDDAARAIVFAEERYDDDLPLNVGSGSGTSIESLAHAICDVVGFQGTLRFDTTKPDGMPSKLLDSSRLDALGYENRTPLRRALAATLSWWRETERK